MTLNEQHLLTESFIQFVKSFCTVGTDADGEWALHLDVSDVTDVRHRLLQWLDQEDLAISPVRLIEAYLDRNNPGWRIEPGQGRAHYERHAPKALKRKPPLPVTEA